MSCEEGSGGRKGEIGIMVFLYRRIIFRNGASDDVGLCRGGYFGEGMVGGGLFFRWRRRKKGFGIGWKVVGAIRRIEAFGEDDDLSSGRSSFTDFVSRMGQILRFV